MAKVAFRQCDVERACRAAKATGVTVVLRFGDLVIECDPVDRPQALAQRAVPEDDKSDGWGWDDYEAAQGRS